MHIITYFTLLALLVEHFLVHWYQQCLTIHHVPKCMSCHKAILVITGRAHFFWSHIYYAHLASARFEHSMCHESLMTSYIYILTLCAFQKMSCIYIKLKDIHKIVIFRPFTNIYIHTRTHILKYANPKNIYVRIYTLKKM